MGIRAWLLIIEMEVIEMKKVLSVILLGLVVFVLSACETANSESLVTSTPESSPSKTEQSFPVEQPESAGSSESSSDAEIPSAAEDVEERESTSRQISVRFGGNTVVYELNDGTAADSLYEQLPLTVEMEDYSTNEKIFYPPQALDTSGSPLAQAGDGTLAYYEPWGDVVFFYGDYNENPSLFELGQVVSGGELISEMSGTITIEALK